MDGPLGLPRNYAAFWPHKGRTKFLCDYNILNFCNMMMGITRFCTKLSDLNIKFCVYPGFKFLKMRAQKTSHDP